MLSNYNTVVSLIDKISSLEVKEAEKQLQNIAKKDVQLFACLHNILKDINQQQKIKNSAALYISSAISDNIAALSNQQTLSILKDILTDSAIAPDYKRMMQRGIVNTIQQLQQPLITQLRQLAFNLTNVQGLRQTGCLLLACFGIAQINSVHLIYLSKVLFQRTMTYIFTESQQSIQNARQYNEIIKTWIVVCNKLMKLFEPKIQQSEKKKNKSKVEQLTEALKIQHAEAAKVLYEIANSQALSTVILNIYKWFTPPEMLIVTDPNLAQLNIIKGQACELQNILTQFSIKHNYQTAIYKFGINYMNDFVKNIIIVATNRKVITNYQLSDFITNLIRTIKHIFQADPQIFTKIWQYILIDMLFPLIAVGEEQLQEFEESPEHFLSLSEDCSEKQKFGVLKTQAAALLQSLGDKSEKMDPQQSCIDFIYKFCVDSMKAFFKINVQTTWDSKLLSYETAIQVLSVFSYRIEYHHDQLLQLRKIFIEPKIRELLPPVECARTYFFLSYNYTQIFKEPNEGDHWVSMALSQNCHPTVTLFALDFLVNLSNEYYTDQFFNEISTKIVTNDNGLFWDLLQKMIDEHCNKIGEELMINMVNSCLQKIQKQIKIVNTEQVKITINITKVLNIFIQILQLQGYCDDKVKLKQTIWRITQAFSELTKLGVSDDVLEIVNLFFKKINTLGDYFNNFLPIILRSFMEDKYEDKEYYYVINQYIMKGNLNAIQIITKSLKTSLMYHIFDTNGQNKSLKQRITVGHVLILLQNVLAVHGNSLNANELYEISSITVRFLPSQKSSQYDKIVAGRVLNTILLCSMFTSTTKQPIENSLIMISEYYKNKVFMGYDVKVLMSCINLQIFKEKQILTIIEMLRIVTHSVFLFKQRKEQERKVKQLRKKSTKNKLQHIKMNRNIQYQTILKGMNTPFQDVDVFSMIKDMLQKMKSQNHDLYQKIIESLDKETKEMLINLCKEVTLENGEKRVIRKVIGIKKLEQVDDFEKMCELKEEQEKAKTKTKKVQQEEGSENDNFEGEMESDDEDIGFKRKRIEEKKKAKAKNSKKTQMKQ